MLRQQVEGVVVQMLSVQADASLAQQSVTGLQGQLRAAQQERAALQTQAAAARREVLLLQVCSECWVMQIHKVFGHATAECPPVPHSAAWGFSTPAVQLALCTAQQRSGQPQPLLNGPSVLALCRTRWLRCPVRRTSCITRRSSWSGWCGTSRGSWVRQPSRCGASSVVAWDECERCRGQGSRLHQMGACLETGCLSGTRCWCPPVVGNPCPGAPRHPPLWLARRRRSRRHGVSGCATRRRSSGLSSCRWEGWLETSRAGLDHLV